MEDKDENFKRRISKLEEEPIKKLKAEKIKDDKTMNRIGENARIALKIMLDGEER